MKYLILLPLIILVFYLITLKKRRRRRIILKKIKLENDNNNHIVNILDGITKGKKLYKYLSAKIHPDRYKDAFKEDATLLNQELTLNKKNYRGMFLLKDKIERLYELNQISND